MSGLGFLNEFPVLRVALDLGGYHEDLAGNTVDVWVNLSEEFQVLWREYNAQVKEVVTKDPGGDLPEMLLAARAALFSELWDVPTEEARALLDKPEAAGLVTWMRRRTWELVEEYSTGRAQE